MSQLFCQPVDIGILFELLDKICLKKEKYYVVDNNAFRKLVFHEYHKDYRLLSFIQTILCDT